MDQLNESGCRQRILGGGADLCADSLCYLSCRSRTAKITRVQRRIRGDMFDSLHEMRGGAALSEVLKQHDDRPERAYRVGPALAHDVEGRTVDRLEHRRVETFGVDVAGGGNAQAAGQCGGQIAQYVGMQIGGDDGVERRGTIDHAGGGRIDQLFVPRDGGKFALEPI